MSLRDRMNRLRGASSEAQAPTTADLRLAAETIPAIEGSTVPNTKDEALHPGWSAFDVRLCRNESGFYLKRRTVYLLTHRHGTHAIGELIQAASGLSAFHRMAGSPNPEEILYLDLETTGLGNGAGNVPFMVGIGYLSGDSFVIEQTLIRHPAEEYAMLQDLMAKLRNYTYLATYNGKTFDWPLVQNRMIMNAISGLKWAPLHLDFLHPSRSIWRNTLASCKLSHIEEERLGISRTEEDVPGSLAPQLYFQFLADGNPAPLEGVFRHNESDLLSLVCLSIRFGWLLMEEIFNRIPYPDEAEELVRTGLWLENMGFRVLSEQLFGRVMALVQPAPSSLLMLAASDKKAGNWERAVLLWQKAILHAGPKYSAEATEACIELAMYYEHRVKDPGSALAFALQALERTESPSCYQRLGAKRRAEQDGIRKRVERLKRKLEQQHNNTTKGRTDDTINSH